MARAPLSNRTAAIETSSVSVGRAWRSASAAIWDQGPRTDSMRSNWWMPCPIVGPPPSTSQRPRHGTSKYASGRYQRVSQVATSGRPSAPESASRRRRTAAAP